MGTEMSAVVTVGAERIHRRRKEQARTAGGAAGWSWGPAAFAASVTAYDYGNVRVRKYRGGFSMPSLIPVFFPSNRVTFSVVLLF